MKGRAPSPLPPTRLSFPHSGPGPAPLTRAVHRVHIRAAREEPLCQRMVTTVGGKVKCGEALLRARVNVEAAIQKELGGGLLAFGYGVVEGILAVLRRA